MSRGGVNLANATNSLTDTSARHHKVSRVCVDFYNALVPDATIDNRGLAPVFTNTAALKTATIANAGAANSLARWYVSLFDCRTIRERTAHLKKPCKVATASSTLWLVWYAFSPPLMHA